MFLLRNNHMKVPAAPFQRAQYPCNTSGEETSTGRSSLTVLYSCWLQVRFLQVRCLLQGVITSVAKDRKAPSGGKSRTREADDAAIFAWMTEFYERYQPQYRVDSLNGQKSSEHDSSTHRDCIPEHKAAGRTPQFYPCAFPAKPQQACHDGREHPKVCVNLLWGVE